MSQTEEGVAGCHRRWRGREFAVGRARGIREERRVTASTDVGTRRQASHITREGVVHFTHSQMVRKIHKRKKLVL